MNKREEVKKEEVLSQEFEPSLESSTELVPLTSASLQHFTEEQQADILRISEQIDVLEMEKIMSYGSIPIMRSFEMAGKILKEEQGTTADQEVTKQVIELAKKANSTYEDFNLAIQEPNFLQKILLKLSTAAKEKRGKDIKFKAVTNYKLLEQLRQSCDAWISMLQKTYEQIMLSGTSDRDDCYELEEYIVAGHIAQDRIAQEVEQARQEWQTTGLIDAKEKYDRIEEGYKTFQVVLLNLEKSRVAYAISLGQLMLQEKANKNIQIAVRTQKANSLALAAQQLRNAVLDAKNKEALDGQKMLTGLNDELMQKVAENTAITAEESEKILLSGVYTVESALVAAQTVIKGCEAIKRAREEVYTNVSNELDKLKTVVDELAPYVNEVKTRSSKNDSTPKLTGTGKNGLAW